MGGLPVKKNSYLHQLMTLPTVLEARLSPDKQWVAFTWYRIHENIDVFLVPSDGSQLPLPLTHTPEATELVSWTPDSSAVIVSEDHDGDEFSRLFRVDISQPLLMQPLTRGPPTILHPWWHAAPKRNPPFLCSQLRFQIG